METSTLLILWGMLAALVTALAVGLYDLYWHPTCPFCGARMVRSRLNSARAYCHACGGIKENGHYWKTEGRP